MRIKSKFTDFYDKALSFGFEGDRVYVRDNIAWENKKSHPDNIPLPKSLSKLQELLHSTAVDYSFSTHGYRVNKNLKEFAGNRLTLEPFLVAVGGEIHKGIWVTKLKKASSTLTVSSGMPSGDTNTHRLAPSLKESLTQLNTVQAEVVFNGAVYSDADLMEALAEMGPALLEENYNGWRYTNSSAARTTKELRAWLQQPFSNQLYHDLMDDKLVTALVTEHEVVKDPCLKDWQFFKKMDPVSCMQELSMFVGNIASPDNTPIVVDDKYRIQQHGFDERSFRKSPTKHSTPSVPKRPHPDSFDM